MAPSFNRQLTKFRFLSTSSLLNRETRVRFAPSPTGDIHFGGLRTAIYNYIFAKANRGKFILRIEDTDQKRIVPQSQDKIEDILKWCGLIPDESPSSGGDFGPYIQSLRIKIYSEKSEELLSSKKAYRCFCSHSRLELLRNFQARNREKIGYDGKCRNLSGDEIKRKLDENEGIYTVRLAVKPKVVSYTDTIFGDLTTDLSTTSDGDPVIMKSDGWPTYHFANVIDDHMMQISHVLRGSEWISSTPKHLLLYEAFGWEPPRFGHLPLITMKDGSKMSKRNNQSQIKSWIDKGYYPIAFINLLTSIGGGLPKDKLDSSDLWDLATIVENFDFDKVVCHPGMIDTDRFKIFNRAAINRIWRENPSLILEDLKGRLSRENIETNINEDQLLTILNHFIGGRITTITDILNGENEFLWKRPSLTWNKQDYTEKGWDLKKIVQDVIKVVEDHDLTMRDEILESLKDVARVNEIEWPDMMKFLRRLLTDKTKGLPVIEIFTCLGKDRLLIYLNDGINFLDAR